MDAGKRSLTVGRIRLGEKDAAFGKWRKRRPWWILLIVLSWPCLTWMSLKRAGVSGVGGCAADGASVSSASEAHRCLWGAAGKSRELSLSLSSFPGCFLHWLILTLSHCFTPPPPLVFLTYSLITSGKDDADSVIRGQMWPSVKSELE